MGEEAEFLLRFLSLSKNLNFCTVVAVMQGELEGAEPASNWIKMPRKALLRKACGERSEDFCAAQQHKNLALFQAVKKVQMDFFDSLRKRSFYSASFFAHCMLPDRRDGGSKRRGAAFCSGRKDSKETKKRKHKG